MKQLLIKLIINAVALGTAAILISGIHYETFTDLLIVAAIFGVVNALLKPLLKALTCPFVALSLGLFILVINAILLWITGELAAGFGVGFTVDTFGAAFFGGLIVSIMSILLNIITPEGLKR